MNNKRTKKQKSESRESLTPPAIRSLTKTEKAKPDQGANVHTLRVVDGGEGIPPEPDWACRFQREADRDAAAAIWAEVIADLRERQVLTVANGAQIVRLIDHRIAYSAAQQELDERGPMLTAKETETRYANPALHVMRGLDESIRQLEGELCLSPLRRAKAGKVVRKVTTSRRADAFLRPANSA